MLYSQFKQILGLIDVNNPTLMAKQLQDLSASFERPDHEANWSLNPEQILEIAYIVTSTFQQEELDAYGWMGGLFNQISDLLDVYLNEAFVVLRLFKIKSSLKEFFAKDTFIMAMSSENPADAANLIYLLHSNNINDPILLEKVIHASSSKYLLLSIMNVLDEAKILNQTSIGYLLASPGHYFAQQEDLLTLLMKAGIQLSQNIIKALLADNCLKLGQTPKPFSAFKRSISTLANENLLTTQRVEWLLSSRVLSSEGDNLFEHLKDLNMLTPENADSIRLICLHQSPDYLLFVFNKLHKHQLLSLANATALFDVTSQLTGYWYEAFYTLFPARLINQANFDKLIPLIPYIHEDSLNLISEIPPAEFTQQVFDELLDLMRVHLQEHQLIIPHLLHYPSVFAYAEQHVREYSEHIVRPFLEQHLTGLVATKQEFESVHPGELFDIHDEKKVRLLFYIVRHLIRVNLPEDREKLTLILALPSLKAIVHTEVTRGESNELLRLALTVGNEQAAVLLLAIPEVRALAQANQFYENEMRGGLDLRQLAQDRESSMTALSPGEALRLAAAKNFYQSKMEAVGQLNCINQLRETLKARYMENPATLKIADETIELPFSWADFKALDLVEPEYSRALKSYYQNVDHTAWRYLAKPNPWMHQEASYVNVNEGRNERWSTFEDYQSLIALLYMAVIDTEIAADEGYTLASRLTHFIHELALIGRAHNWDKRREKLDKDGEPQLDDLGELITEEYDDLAADRPSCFSGNKRRLFQAVQGHPLFVFLTKEKVQMELNDFVRMHFQKVITQDNRQSVKTAWNNIISCTSEDTEAEDIATLQVLNVSLAQQKLFIEALTVKYGQQFTHDTSFTNLIFKAFTPQLARDTHIQQFGYLKPEQFMENVSAQDASIHSNLAFNRYSLFANQIASEAAIDVNVNDQLDQLTPE